VQDVALVELHDTKSEELSVSSKTVFFRLFVTAVAFFGRPSRRYRKMAIFDYEGTKNEFMPFSKLKNLHFVS
jgi:hypothetical protein